MRITVFLLMTSAAITAQATVDEHKGYFDLAGTGKTAVVLARGWTGNGPRWNAQRQELASRSRVLIVDLPRHGKSDKPEITYSIPLFSRAVLAGMDAAKIDRAVLVRRSALASAARMQGPSDADARRKFVQSMFTDATSPELQKQILASMPAAHSILLTFIGKVTTN